MPCLMLVMISALSSCGTKKLPPLQTVPQVDLQRFMGDWWVIANIPTFVEKNCFNALEQYELRDDGDINIQFSCNKNSFDGKLKKYRFRGLIENKQTNAEWRVQIFWPLRLPYLVIDLADDYSFTVIGYPSRQYLWIMARKKNIPEKTYNEILARLERQGYDLSKIQKIPLR
jgi:apolipoprotein D and lipocalin family protein